MRSDADLPTLPDADEDLRVHVEECDEGEDAGGEGGMPGQGQRVPEDERRVLPATIGGLANLKICTLIKKKIKSS